MTQFADDDWGRPVEASGDWARVDQLAGRLLIIFPLGYIPYSPTRFSQQGKKSDVIVCDVIDLDDADEHGSAGKVYRTAWWRSAQLIVSLRPWIGKRVLGRIGKGVARNGMNPPWVVNDATPEPGALDRARAWAHAHQDFALSPFEQPPAVQEAPPQQYPQQPPQGYPQQPPQPLGPPQGYPPQQGGYPSPPMAPPITQQWPQPQPHWAPQAPPTPPQFQPPGPPPPAPPQYQPQPTQPQYQQVPQHQAAPQPGPYQQQPMQQAPAAYPVAGSQQYAPDTLELMRAERERRLAQGEDPPF